MPRDFSRLHHKKRSAWKASGVQNSAMDMNQTLPSFSGSPIDDRRWAALLARDDDVRGVYAVQSTGVYCHFGCPSRPPLRRNVVFFEGTDAARAAGYRACRRCGARTTPPEPVLEMCRFIESQAGRVPSLQELAERFGMSPSHLQRVFKRRVGVSPRAYADALRVDRLKERLRRGEPVVRAMVDAGYSSASRLYENVSQTLGMTPKSYRKRAEGEEITYATVRCPVGGYLLVAATARGLCAVRMGDRARELVAELEQEFAGAALVRGGHRFTDEILAYLRGLRPLPALPLDIRATVFQRRVWEAIRAVPAGETATYGDVANAVGAPRAARAVARACAQNPVALAIPCHRIVPAAGGNGGYRWGETRKEKLLRLEAAGAAAAAAGREAEATTSEARPTPT